jgi:hypothetical protein
MKEIILVNKNLDYKKFIKRKALESDYETLINCIAVEDEKELAKIIESEDDFSHIVLNAKEILKKHVYF